MATDRPAPPDDAPRAAPAGSPPDAVALAAVILGVISVALPLLTPVIVMTGPFLLVFAPPLVFAEFLAVLATLITGLIGAHRGLSRPMALTGLGLAGLGVLLSAVALTNGVRLTLLEVYWARFTLGL